MRLSFDQILKEKERKRIQHEEAKLRNENNCDSQNRYALNAELKHKFEKMEEEQARALEEMFPKIAATEKQKSYLIYLGCCFDQYLTRKKASLMIDEALDRIKRKKKLSEKKHTTQNKYSTHR